MSLRSLLRMRCTIQRWGTREPNDLGHIGPPQWADATSGVRCLVQQHSARILRSAAGVNITYNATGFFLPATDLRARPHQAEKMDRIRVTAGGQGTYDVKGVIDEAGMDRLLTVALESA